MKKVINHMVQAVLLLVAGIAGGYILLAFAYLLPVEPMQKNLAESAGILNTEREYHRVIPGYVSTQLDNYTDAWMMGNAVYDNPLPVWERALTCTSADYGAGPLDGLIRYTAGEDGYREISYTRYWHGYLIVLKPFFLLFDYADLRFVNVVLELFLVIGVFRQMNTLGYCREAWGYVVSVLFVMPVVVPLSIQFSVIFYLANVSAFVLLKNYQWIAQHDGLLLYFQLTGMTASFFDLLTYPIASLGVPLVCLLVLTAERGFWNRLKEIISMSVSWGFGYGAMWAGKWILSTLVLNDNVIANALSQIAMRSSHIQDGEQITILDTWLRNVVFYFEKPYLILIITCVIVALVGLLKGRRQLKNIIADVILYTIIAVIPFAWYAAAGQHSYEHHWFTFRALMTSVFACMCMCARFYKTDTGHGRG